MAGRWTQNTSDAYTESHIAPARSSGHPGRDKGHGAVIMLVHTQWISNLKNRNLFQNTATLHPITGDLISVW